MNILNVTVRTNSDRNVYGNVLDTTTIRSFLEEKGVDYTRGATNLEGTTLLPGDFDRTFADFGITTKCFLTNVVKADNA